MNDGMNYDEMFDYVAKHKATIDDTKPYLRDRLQELTAMDKDGLKPRIEAIQLILKGIELGERVSPGMKTEDQTHCKCGMEICMADFGSNNDELVVKSNGLLHAWSEYETKLKILRKKYDESTDGKSNPEDLTLN